MFTVYGNGAHEHFFLVHNAYDWAVEQHAQTGATYECRDDDFNHVFTVED